MENQKNQFQTQLYNIIVAGDLTPDERASREEVQVVVEARQLAEKAAKLLKDRDYIRQGSMRCTFREARCILIGKLDERYPEDRQILLACATNKLYTDVSIAAIERLSKPYDLMYILDVGTGYGKSDAFAKGKLEQCSGTLQQGINNEQPNFNNKSGSVLG